MGRKIHAVIIDIEFVRVKFHHTFLPICLKFGRCYIQSLIVAFEMYNLEGLVPLSSSTFKKAVNVLIRAFWDDPLNAYFFPDETKRKRILPAFFEFRLKQGKACGEVYVTSDDVEGIAIWKYHDKLDISFWKILRLGGLKLYRLCGRALINRMMKTNEWSDNRRNELANPPYLHLGSFAVDPEMQCKGFASKLIRPMLAHLDEMNWDCCLETQSESNVSLYEHYGFEILGKSVMPDTNLPHWNMIRYSQ
jgi:ribosomal protein S18 acetylase RimI-like enzyme